MSHYSNKLREQLWRVSSGAALTVLCTGVFLVFGDMSRLSVSSNNRYLKDASGHPFFLVGDCPQNLPIKLAISELEDYMADCEIKGFNLLWICIDGQRTASPTDLAPKDRDNHLMMTSDWDIGTFRIIAIALSPRAMEPYPRQRGTM